MATTKSYKEAEFERNARTIVENLQAAERGDLIPEPFQ